MVLREHDLESQSGVPGVYANSNPVLSCELRGWYDHVRLSE